MSRDLDHLAPDVRALAHSFLALCNERGLDVIVTCTYRSPEEQAELYAQGRTKPGKIVTKAKPGQSLHNLEDAEGFPAARAFDVVPIRLGKPVWGTKGEDLVLWQRVGQAGKDVGLEWAGDWPRFTEFPHLQLRA